MKKTNAIKQLRLLILLGARNLQHYGLDNLQSCQFLQKLDISQCSVERLPRLPSSLLILNINNNKLKELKSIECLLDLNLIYLTIFQNPITEPPEDNKLRHFLVNKLSSLQIYDRHVVVDDERSASSCWPQPLSRKTHVGYPLVIYSGLKVEEAFLNKLNLQLQVVRRLWLNCKAGFIILKQWRRHRARKRTLANYMGMTDSSPQDSIRHEDQPPFHPLRHVFRQMKEVLKTQRRVKEQMNKRGQQHLVMSDFQFWLQELRRKVKPLMSGYLRRLRQRLKKRKAQAKIKGTLMFYSQFFGRTLPELLRLHEFKRIFIQKASLKVFERAAVQILRQFNHIHRTSLDSSVYKLTPNTQYRVFRTFGGINNHPTNHMLQNLLFHSLRIQTVKVRQQGQQKRQGLSIKVKIPREVQKLLGRLSIEQQRRKDELNEQINNYQQINYRKKIVKFQCSHIPFLCFLIKRLLSLQTPVPFFFDCIMRRVHSAMIIQRNWKAFKVRQLNKNQINFKLALKRASHLLMRFYSQCRSASRNSMLRYIDSVISRFKDKSFMIEQRNYFLIPSDDAPSKGFNFSQFQFSLFVNQSSQLQVNYTLLPHFPSNLLRKLIKSRGPWHTSDIYSLLHTGSKLNKLRTGDVIFYQFQFENIETLQLRLYLFLLKTYNKSDRRKSMQVLSQQQFKQKCRDQNISSFQKSNVQLKTAVVGGSDLTQRYKGLLSMSKAKQVVTKCYFQNSDKKFDSHLQHLSILLSPELIDQILPQQQQHQLRLLNKLQKPNRQKQRLMHFVKDKPSKNRAFLQRQIIALKKQVGQKREIAEKQESVRQLAIRTQRDKLKSKNKQMNQYRSWFKNKQIQQFKTKNKDLHQLSFRNKQIKDDQLHKHARSLSIKNTSRQDSFEKTFMQQNNFITKQIMNATRFSLRQEQHSKKKSAVEKSKEKRIFFFIDQPNSVTVHDSFQPSEAASSFGFNLTSRMSVNEPVAVQEPPIKYDEKQQKSLRKWQRLTHAKFPEEFYPLVKNPVFQFH